MRAHGNPRGAVLNPTTTEGQGTANPAKGSPQPVLAFDWSGSRVDYTSDGVVVNQAQTIEEVVDQLIEPTLIVGEDTFHSYEKHKRHELIQRCADAGHTLRTFSPRDTEKWRRVNGIEKSDEADARAIFGIVLAGVVALKGPTCRCDDCADPEFSAYREKHEAIRRELVMRRYTHQYDEVLERATRYLGEPRYLEGEDRLVLADNVNPAPRAARWRAPLIVTLVICAEAAESRDEFERLLGLHGSGYPSIMRSNVYYHGLANHYKRAGKARGMEPEEYHNDISRLKDARTQFRRVIRRAYHKIRQGRSEPVTGTVEPADTGQHSTRDGQNETRSGGA